MRKRTQSGFSMIELMTVVVIILILSAIALPNFLIGLRNNQLNAASSELSMLIQRARYEAVRRNDTVAVREVVGSDPQQVYVDVNNDIAPQVTEPTIVLRANFQLNVAGAPGFGSMSYTGAAPAPLPNIAAFDGRGGMDFTTQGLNILPKVLIITVGDASRPQDGFRAVATTPQGRSVVWRVTPGATYWSH